LNKRNRGTGYGRVKTVATQVIGNMLSEFPRGEVTMATNMFWEFWTVLREDTIDGKRKFILGPTIYRIIGTGLS